MLLKIKSKDCGRLTSEHYTGMNQALTLKITNLEFETEDGQDFVYLSSLEDLQTLLDIPGVSFSIEVQNK